MLRAVLAAAIALLLLGATAAERSRAATPILTTAAILALVLTLLHDREEPDGVDRDVTHDELTAIASRITTASDDEIETLEEYVRSDGPHWGATPRSRFLEEVALHLLSAIKQLRGHDKRDELLGRVLDGLDGTCDVDGCTEPHGFGGMMTIPCAKHRVDEEDPLIPPCPSLDTLMGDIRNTIKRRG